MGGWGCDHPSCAMEQPPGHRPCVPPGSVLLVIPLLVQPVRKRASNVAGVPRKRVAEGATDRLRAAILRGVYPAGTDLPGERELSLTLGVSRLTLRSSLARLEGEGLVQPVHGLGNRVLDYRETGGVELVGHLASLGADGPEAIGLFRSLLELRRALAVEAIGLAVQRATESEILALGAHVERQGTLVDDPEAYVRSDLELARIVARMTHNLPLLFLANTIVRLLEQQPGIELAFVLDPRATLAFYRRVVVWLARRDAESARTLARRMIARLDRALLTRLEAIYPQAFLDRLPSAPPPQEEHP